MASNLEVVGVAPELKRVTCDAVLCEQYWHEGRLESAANVIYLSVAGEWHRLTFDCGIIFWRTQAERPEPYSMPEYDAEAKIDDLGLRLDLASLTLEFYAASLIPGGSQVSFNFEGFGSVTFKNVDDVTTVAV